MPHYPIGADVYVQLQFETVYQFVVDVKSGCRLVSSAVHSAAVNTRQDLECRLPASDKYFTLVCGASRKRVVDAWT